MPKWKDISKISSKEERQREAAFEAATMAELAKEKQPRQTSPQPSTPSSTSITITVTEDGKTTTYPDLASVPLPLRQRIVNAWLSATKM